MPLSPLPELVTLEQAKQHLRLPDYGSPVSAEDQDLQLKLEIAHELVLDYVNQRLDDAETWEATIDAWTSSTVPKRIKGAILYEFGRLYRERGDDEAGQGGEPLLSRFSRVLLDRFRDPAVS